MNTTQTKFVDAAWLEERYGCDRSAFARWVVKRGFPAPRYLGHRRVWLLTEIEAWEVEAFASEPSRSSRNLKAFKRADESAGALVTR